MWYDTQKGYRIESYDEFKKKVTNDGAEMQYSHILIEFYMPHCPWCERFSQGWDEMYEEFTGKYSNKTEGEYKDVDV